MTNVARGVSQDAPLSLFRDEGICVGIVRVSE